MFKPIGYFKNKSTDFEQIKKDIEQKKNRFKKQPQRSTGTPKGSDALLLQNSDSGVELSEAQGLPPTWVDHYDVIKTNLDKLNPLYRELNSIISKRITDTFGTNQGKLDQQIREKSQEAMKLLHESEEHLELIERVKDPKESDSDRIVRKNIHKSLASQISEKTVLLRKQQKNLYNKITENKGSGTNLFVGNESTSLGEDMEESNEQEMAERLGEQKDAEINQLVETMNELGNIFKQLNQMVMDQGNILDRIDFNIEQTLDNTKKANVELRKAVQYQDSACARKCIYLLVALIAIFTIVLVVKYKK